MENFGKFKKPQVSSRVLVLDILELLMEKPRKVSELLKVTGSNENIVRKHLKTLEEFGFASFEKAKGGQIWIALLIRNE